jgi:hypothetical protein
MRLQASSPCVSGVLEMPKLDQKWIRLIKLKMKFYRGNLVPLARLEPATHGLGIRCSFTIFLSAHKLPAVVSKRGGVVLILIVQKLSMARAI